MSAPSAYGKHLFDLLPEIYRQRDRTQPPRQADHLRNYLDSHGVLLDRVRDTLEQLYADHFPDVPEEGRVCQSWIIPYLADLVGASPVSPFADGQRDEVANAIRWSKRKGTLVAVEEILETIALSEAEIQEGWRRVIVTARPDDTILPAAYFGEPAHPIDTMLVDRDPSLPFTSVNPLEAAQHPGIRTATIDCVRPHAPCGRTRRDRNRGKPVRHRSAAVAARRQCARSAAARTDRLAPARAAWNAMLPGLVRRRVGQDRETRGRPIPPASTAAIIRSR